MRGPTQFLDELRSHFWLDRGRLAVAHAGLKEEMIGRGSGAVREFALFGETTGRLMSSDCPYEPTGRRTIAALPP